MPQRKPSAKTRSPRQKPGTITSRPRRVLLVDSESKSCGVLARALGDERTALLHAATLREARQTLEDNTVDVILAEAEMPDGSGIEWVAQLSRERPAIRTIVLSGSVSLETAMGAIRAGAVDYLTKPLDVEELSLRVRSALERQKVDRKLRRRVRRLRRVCDKLSTARDEVTQQVDLLCADLVSAYQELAVQMHQVVHTSEFAAVSSRELDLEQLLRKSLEYLLEKAGPTNAAIFLPATIDEFSLGGYVNYDWSNGAPDILLQQLADIVAPRLAEYDGVVHITKPEIMAEWAGDDSEYLQGCHLIGVVCCHEEEPLAVIVLFRDAKAPFDRKVVETCGAVAPLLGEYLAKIIRIHHRHLPDEPLGDDEDDLLPGEDEDDGLDLGL